MQRFLFVGTRRGPTGLLTFEKYWPHIPEPSDSLAHSACKTELLLLDLFTSRPPGYLDVSVPPSRL